jgi:hypothetical protein
MRPRGQRGRDFSGGVEGVAVPGQCAPKARIGGDGGMSDAIDRAQEVPHPDGVQSAPSAEGKHAGVDLQMQMQMAMRVAGTGGVVPHGHRLQVVDRDLHLVAT